MADNTAKSPNDVAKPGTTAPSATSKPVIVGHTSSVQDPMVSKADAAQEQPSGVAAAKEAPATPSTSTGSSKPKIMPTTAADDLKKQASTEEDKQHAEDVPVDEKKEDAPDYQARLGEIIESGEYNVSIKPAGGSAKTFIITTLTIFLTGIFTLFLLIDLQIVDMGFKPPFSIFNKTKPTNSPAASDTTPMETTKKVSLPVTKLSFTYDPTIWKVELSKNNNATDYSVNLVLKEDDRSFIAIYDKKDPTPDNGDILCSNGKNCSSDVTDFTSEKIPNVKNKDLYAMSYIKKVGSNKPYYVYLNVGRAATQQDLDKSNMLLINDDSTMLAGASSHTKSINEGSVLSGFATLEEAQAIIKSAKYQAAKKVLLTASDQ